MDWSDPAVPQRVGRYRVIGRLAVGGMAEILIGAIDGAAGFARPVVVKRVLPKHARRQDFRRMFVDEARIVSGLRHPNVVDVLELGEEHDALYLVMEYLEGESLDVVMKRLGSVSERLSAAITARVIADACAGLHAAHELRDADGVAQQIVHRDVSPHNIFLGYDGHVKVIDFGIAKAVNRETKTETGTVKGKFAYMSPEQIDGSNVDRRTDVFALGVVLWEALAGRRLFSRSNQLEIVKAICFAPIPAPRDVDPAIDPELDRIAQKALSRDLEERYATAADMRRDLAAALRSLDPEGVSGEQLAALLSRLFDERIASKREMLRKIASGSQVTSVPGAIDVDLDEPDHAPPPSPTAQRPRARPVAPAAAVAVALAIAVIAGGALAWGTGQASIAPVSPVISVAPAVAPATSPSPTVASTDTPPDAEPQTVSVAVDTVPAGASITIDGAPRGVSPTVVSLARGEDTHSISVELAGYLTAREILVPSVDQRLRIVLQRARRGAPTKRPSPRTGPSPTIFRVD